MTTLNERLDRAMKLRGWTVPAEFAREVELSKGGLSYILNGTTRAETIRATTIDRMANVLKVNRDWLLYGTGPMEGVAPGPGVAVSYVKRLDPAIVAPAAQMARTMVATHGGDFDPVGDVPLFIAAYELMADATVENRARFDAALTQRVAAAATQGDNRDSRSNSTARSRGKPGSR